MALPALNEEPAAKGLVVMTFGPKGGVGKTTISGHLAVSARKSGHRALAVDLDPQKGLSLWAEERSSLPISDQLVHFDSTEAKLSDWQAVLEAAKSYDVTVLDLPPGIEGNYSAVYGLAERCDLVIIPTGQSRLDLMHVLPWMARFKERKIKAVFCMNKTTAKNWGSYKRAKAELVGTGVFAPIEIPLYEDIISTGSGITVFDNDRMRGHFEFSTLYSYVCREIGL